MLLQTNSYTVPKEKRVEHARLLRRFQQALAHLGCDNFEVFEQVGPNWSGNESTGRFVQIMRFRDRKHQVAVQEAERHDPLAQSLIAQFCELVDLPYQQEQGLFAVGFYRNTMPAASGKAAADVGEDELPAADDQPSAATGPAPDAASEQSPAAQRPPRPF